VYTRPAPTNRPGTGFRIDPYSQKLLLVNGAQFDRFPPAHSRADIVVLDIRMRSRQDRPRPRQRHPMLGAGNSDWFGSNGFGTQWADDSNCCPTPRSRGDAGDVESVDHVTETAKRLPNVPIVACGDARLERITEIAATKATSARLGIGLPQDTGW